MMGLRLYLCLSVYGTQFFGNYVTRMYDLTREFAQVIVQSDDFQLAAKPQSNIICFRYIKANVENLDEYQKAIRKKILEQERFYIVQAQLKDGDYLRCTIINPLTTMEDLMQLLDAIRSVVKDC